MGTVASHPPLPVHSAPVSCPAAPSPLPRSPDHRPPRRSRTPPSSTTSRPARRRRRPYGTTGPRARHRPGGRARLRQPARRRARRGAWDGGGAAARTVGRLFFHAQGEDASCTATVVDSGNRDVVVTGGHCAVTHDLLGEHPEWIGQALFVPGFRDGEAPYGTFVVRTGVADSRWVESGENTAYDQAFLVLNENESGDRVADAVGATQKIAFDAEQGVPVQEFGYPRVAATEGPHSGRPEFIGRRLAHCYGTAVATPDDMWGVPCDMGGGSSGGPASPGSTRPTAGARSSVWTCRAPTSTARTPSASRALRAASATWWARRSPRRSAAR
ncbi:peptidase [Streptomyces sp. M19]